MSRSQHDEFRHLYTDNQGCQSGRASGDVLTTSARGKVMARRVNDRQASAPQDCLPQRAVRDTGADVEFRVVPVPWLSFQMLLCCRLFRAAGLQNCQTPHSAHGRAWPGLPPPVGCLRPR